MTTFLIVEPGDTCWSYARRVWRSITGVDIGEQPGYSERPDMFVEVDHDAPDPKIVLFEDPVGRLHVGVSFRGRVWHLRPNGVAEGARPMSMQEHGSRRYYKCA